jgi:thiosulfate reductase cytochrome b subunit
MSTVFVSWSLLYCFYIYVLVNEVANFFRVDMIPPIEEEDPL